MSQDFPWYAKGQVFGIYYQYINKLCRTNKKGLIYEKTIYAICCFSSGFNC